MDRKAQWLPVNDEEYSSSPVKLAWHRQKTANKQLSARLKRSKEMCKFEKFDIRLAKNKRCPMTVKRLHILPARDLQ